MARLSLSHFTLLALLAALTGCFKPVETKAPEVTPPPPAEPFSTAAATAPAQPATSVAGIPAAAIGAAHRAVAKVEIASTATADNGTLYRQAQTLLAEKKPAEALRVLDQIQAELMTGPQEKAVAELRAKIKAALGQ